MTKRELIDAIQAVLDRDFRNVPMNLADFGAVDALAVFRGQQLVDIGELVFNAKLGISMDRAMTEAAAQMASS